MIRHDYITANSDIEVTLGTLGISNKCRVDFIARQKWLPQMRAKSDKIKRVRVKKTTETWRTASEILLHVETCSHGFTAGQICPVIHVYDEADNVIKTQSARAISESRDIQVMCGCLLFFFMPEGESVGRPYYRRNVLRFRSNFSLNHPHLLWSRRNTLRRSILRFAISDSVGRYRIVGIPRVVIPYGSGYQEPKVAENTIRLTRWWIDALLMFQKRLGVGTGSACLSLEILRYETKYSSLKQTRNAFFGCLRRNGSIQPKRQRRSQSPSFYR